jgi:hypothetical protein
MADEDGEIRVKRVKPRRRAEKEGKYNRLFAAINHQLVVRGMNTLLLL